MFFCVGWMCTPLFVVVASRRNTTAFNIQFSKREYNPIQIAQCPIAFLPYFVQKLTFVAGLSFAASHPRTQYELPGKRRSAFVVDNDQCIILPWWVYYHPPPATFSYGTLYFHCQPSVHRLQFTH